MASGLDLPLDILTETKQMLADQAFHTSVHFPWRHNYPKNACL